MTKSELFSDPQFNKKLVTLALPIALQQLMLAAVAACDAIMLGRVDQNSMSAVSLAGQIQFIQNIIFWASTGAASVLGAQYWGKGDHQTMDDIFCICLRINIINSLVFWAGCIFIPDKLMMIYTNEPELVLIGASYLRVAGWSYLLTGISETYLTVLKVTNHVSIGAVISSSAVVFNIFFNAVFIFGLLGVPAMGARGAAAATVISRVIQVIWAFTITCRPGYIRIHLRNLFRHPADIFRDFMKCALPILCSGGLWGVGFSSYTAILGHLGADAAAANSVSSVVRDLFCCLCNARLSATCSAACATEPPMAEVLCWETCWEPEIQKMGKCTVSGFLKSPSSSDLRPAVWSWPLLRWFSGSTFSHRGRNSYCCR